MRRPRITREALPWAPYGFIGECGERRIDEFLVRLGRRSWTITLHRKRNVLREGDR